MLPRHLDQLTTSFTDACVAEGLAAACCCYGGNLVVPEVPECPRMLRHTGVPHCLA